MVEEIPQSSELKTSDVETPGDNVGTSEQERAAVLAAQIALLKAKLQNTEAIARHLHEMMAKQREQLDAWLEELASIKEGQLLLKGDGL